MKKLTMLLLGVSAGLYCVAQSNSAPPTPSGAPGMATIPATSAYGAATQPTTRPIYDFKLEEFNKALEDWQEPAEFNNVAGGSPISRQGTKAVPIILKAIIKDAPPASVSYVYELVTVMRKSKKWPLSSDLLNLKQPEEGERKISARELAHIEKCTLYLLNARQQFWDLDNESTTLMLEIVARRCPSAVARLVACAMMMQYNGMYDDYGRMKAESARRLTEPLEALIFDLAADVAGPIADGQTSMLSTQYNVSSLGAWYSQYKAMTFDVPTDADYNRAFTRMNSAISQIGKTGRSAEHRALSNMLRQAFDGYHNGGHIEQAIAFYNMDQLIPAFLEAVSRDDKAAVLKMVTPDYASKLVPVTSVLKELSILDKPKAIRMASEKYSLNECSSTSSSAIISCIHVSVDNKEYAGTMVIRLVKTQNAWKLEAR